MEARAKPDEFDLAARERIRRRLRRYMEAHKIGTPALKSRIEEADVPHHRELPLSTLQRFVTGKHRTLDAYVGMFSNFLDKQDEEPDDEDFGEALTAFLRAPEAGEHDLPESGMSGFAGSYYAFYAAATREEPLPVPQSLESAASQLNLMTVEEAPYLLAEEQIKADPLSDGRRRYGYTGVAVPRGDMLYMLLRSTLTRLPRTYGVRPRRGAGSDRLVLEGEGFEYPATQSNRSHCKVQLVQPLAATFEVQS